MKDITVSLWIDGKKMCENTFKTMERCEIYVQNMRAKYGVLFNSKDVHFAKFIYNY